MTTGNVIVHLEGQRLFGDPPEEMRRFTVSVPEWHEMIHIIPEDAWPEDVRRERKRQQVLRLVTSPVPEIVRRVTSIIGWIDDAEDLLSTALALGRVLQLPIPARAVPYLGWILTARDLAEMFSLVTSVTGVGQAGKRNGIDILERTCLKSGCRLRKVERFKRHVPGVGALIEGLQATDTLTGVGISLGPIMGMQHDILFSIVRLAQGQRVKVRLPDPTTLEGLAAYVLTFSPYVFLLAPFLPAIKVMALIGAVLLAWGWFTRAVDAELANNRYPDVAQALIPQFVPRRQLTREVLAEHGIDPNRDEPPPWPFEDTAPDFQAYQNATNVYWKPAIARIRAIFGKTVEGTFTAISTREAARLAWNWFEDSRSNMVFSPNAFDIILMRCIQHGVNISRRTSPAPLA